MPPLKHALKQAFRKADIQSAIRDGLWAAASTLVMAEIWPTKLPYEVQSFKDLHALARDEASMTDEEKMIARRRAAESMEDARRVMNRARQPMSIIDLCRDARTEAYGQIANLLGPRVVEHRGTKQRTLGNDSMTGNTTRIASLTAEHGLE